jgi:hypothetical protein
MVDSMFSGCGGEEEPACADGGTTSVEGAEITWSKDSVTGDITLIVDGDEGYTEITIPGSGEFNF